MTGVQNAKSIHNPAGRLEKIHQPLKSSAVAIGELIEPAVQTEERRIVARQHQEIVGRLAPDLID